MILNTYKVNSLNLSLLWEDSKYLDNNSNNEQFIGATLLNSEFIAIWKVSEIRYNPTYLNHFWGFP